MAANILKFDQNENYNFYGKKVEQIVYETTSKSTKRAYDGDIKYFLNWLKAIGIAPSFPTHEEILLQFIFHHLESMPEDVEIKLMEMVNGKGKKGNHSLATVIRRLRSITKLHVINNMENPCTAKVRNLLSAFTKIAAPQRRAKAITKDILMDILATCGFDKLRDIRDKAIILFGWASGGRRRSEISDADMKDLTELSNGNYTYRIPRSKTDQMGKGALVPINGISAYALREWLNRSGIKSGRIFRGLYRGKLEDKLSDCEINNIVKKRCKRAGYDPEIYSAHSLRSGFVTEAGKNGCPIGDVMQLSCHKSINTAMIYYQAGNLSNNKAANLM